MDFDNMNRNDGFEEARRIIAEAQRNRPLGTCCFPTNNNSGVTGPTGPTGPAGPTDTYDYFFNKINRNYSSLIPYKYINYEYIKKIIVIWVLLLFFCKI